MLQIAKYNYMRRALNLSSTQVREFSLTVSTDSDEKVGLGHARLFDHYVRVSNINNPATTQSDETRSGRRLR